LFTLQPILQSNTKIITAYKPLGNGRIGTSVFENTYQLILNGNTNVYQTLWYKTINALSRKQVPLADWETNSMIVFKDEPFHFGIRTHSPNPVVLSENQQAIPLINDIDIESLWKGTTYPKKSGWQTQRLEQDTMQAFHYYVTDTTHWTSLQSYNNIMANKRQFEAKQIVNKPYTTQQPMSLTWLYLLFLFSIGYLWLEPKL